MKDIELTMEQNAFAYEAMLRSIYKSPDIACIRELIRNAIDSHIDNNVDRKVDVGFSETFMYLRDYGSGITHDMLEELMSVLMKSNKRHDNSKSTGGYGLGSKTPFGILYNDIQKERPLSTITMESVADGVRTVYALTIEEGAPRYKTLLSHDSDLPSGITYFIQKSKTMMNLTDSQFLYIFAPILEHINFVGEDFSQFIDVIDVGNFKVAIRRNPIIINDNGIVSVVGAKNINLPPVSSSNRAYQVTRLNGSEIDDYSTIQFRNMIYPNTVINRNTLMNKEQFLTDYVERYIHTESRLENYRYSNSKYIIIHDIGTDSFGMEPTRPRDSLITEGMEYKRYLDQHTSDILHTTHADFALAGIYSLLTVFLEYLKTKKIEYNEFFDHEVFIKPTNIETVMAVLITYIVDDEFMNSFDEIDNELKSLQSNDVFTKNDIIRILTIPSIWSGKFEDETSNSLGIYSSMRTVLSGAYHLLIGSLSGKYDEMNSEVLQYIVAPKPSLFSLAKYDSVIYDDTLRVKFSPHSTNDIGAVPRLNVISSYSVENGIVVEKKHELDYVNIMDSSVMDQFILVYKTARINKNKMEQFVLSNPDKTVLVIDANGTINSQSRMVGEDIVDAIHIGSSIHMSRLAFIKYHQKHPVLKSSDVMKMFKCTKSKTVKNKPIKVPNLDATARNLTICSKDIRATIPTYQELVNAVEKASVVYVFNANGLHLNDSTQIVREYTQHKITYGFTMYGKAPRFSYNICSLLNTKKFSVGSEIIDDSDLDDVLYIMVGDNVSKAALEYISGLQHKEDGREFFMELITKFEENNFRLSDTLIDDIDYHEFIDQYTVEYIKNGLIKRLNDEAKSRAPIVQFENSLKFISRKLANKHITTIDECSNPDILDELPRLIQILTPSDYEKYDTKMRYRKERCDDLIQSYNAYELEFLVGMASLMTGHFQNNLMNEVEKVFNEMEKMYKL